jgi:hypothetical protein
VAGIHIENIGPKLYVLAPFSLQTTTNYQVYKQTVSYINYIALGYIPGRLTTANQMKGTKWQEHSDRHVFDYWHTTGSSKSFVARPEQQGILSVKLLILIVYYALQ